MSSCEWAAALCCAPLPLLPPGTCALDFEGGDGDGTLCERYASLLERSSQSPAGCKGPWSDNHVRFANWLHECVVGSKLCTYPSHLLLYLQTAHVADNSVESAVMCCSPSSPVCSAMAADQLVTVEQFYRHVRDGIGARHEALLSEEFLAERCGELRDAFAEGRPLTDRIRPALRPYYLPERRAGLRGTSSAGRDDEREKGTLAADSVADATALALFCRLHGLPCEAPPGLEDLCTERPGGGALKALPRLRRLLREASAQGLRVLARALIDNGPL